MSLKPWICRVWLLIIITSLSGVCVAGVTERVSVASDGRIPVISANGRFVAFSSNSSNLVPGDTNDTYDVFVHDRQTGITERASVATGGAQGNYYSQLPSISADGRFVAFDSGSSNLVPGDTNGTSDVFVHDRQTGVTERVSIASGGAQGDWESWNASISGDGRFVAFGSRASNLVPGDTNGYWYNYQWYSYADVFVHDRQTGVTEIISVATGGTPGNWDSDCPYINADGRFVAFVSSSSNLVPGDTNNTYDVFVHDRQMGVTERVSVATGGSQSNDESQNSSISADGRFVAFDSPASNLVPSDTNHYCDVFVHDRQVGVTERVSVATGGTQGDRPSQSAYISADSRFVAFQSFANLVPGNRGTDIFVHDRQTGITERVSVATGGSQGNYDSQWPSISADGRFAAFWSNASNLVPGDTNGIADVFVHDCWATGTSPTSDSGTSRPATGSGYDMPLGATAKVFNPYYGYSVQSHAKGQMHSHYYNDTEREFGPIYVGMLGAGSITPNALLASYELMGYDFVCVTEHGHCTTAATVSYPLDIKYCEEATAGKSHVLAVGINHSGCGYVESDCRYFPWDLQALSNGLCEVENATDGSLKQSVQRIHDWGGMAIVAHPTSRFYGTSDIDIRYSQPDAISVYTAATNFSSDATATWDRLLQRNVRVPTTGWSMPLFAITEDDFTPVVAMHAHARSWVVTELDAAGGGRDNILRALKLGRFWSYRSISRHYGKGPLMSLWVTWDAGIPIINVSSSESMDRIEFIGQKKDLGSGTLASASGTSASYRCTGSEKYIRVQARRGDTTVYSQPVAIDWVRQTAVQASALIDRVVTASGDQSDVVVAFAEQEELPAVMPPNGYIGRAHIVSTASGEYPTGLTFTLSYEGQDVIPYGTSNLAIYRWNAAAESWEKLTSTIDIGNALITAPLTQAGLYAISAEIIGDTPPPTVTIHTPTDGATLTGLDVVGVQAYDNVGVLRASFYLDDECIGVDSTGYNGYTCEYDFGRKSAEAYTLKVVAEDVSGNKGEAHVTVNISSSGVTPTVAITSPLNNAVLENTATVTGTCGDDTLVAGVFVAVDGMPVGEANITDGNWTFNLDTSVLANGPHMLSANVLDGDLNTSQASINVIVSGPTLANVSVAKLLDDGERARLTGRVVTLGAPGYENGFYVEEQNRSSGMRVEGSLIPTQGDLVSVSGLMSTIAGERALVGADVLSLSSSNPLPAPLGLANILLGGGPFGSYSPGVTGGYGLQNLGILVCVWGKVTQIGADYLYINDGSNLKDGTVTDVEHNIGIRVICDPTGYQSGQYIAVTGISSCFKTDSDSLARRILTRSQQDIQLIGLE